MRVLDLFSGLRGWSDPWKERGHEVLTLDVEPSFESDLILDMSEFVTDFDRYLHGWRPDVILASPPCEAFSVMTIGRNWTMDHQPKTDKARLALELVGHTLYAIHWLRPRFWVIENPRAKLRKLAPMYGLDRVTITYCQYGEPYMKPTDLWGGFPPSWWPRPACKPKSPCHASAARGSRTGIQGESVKAVHPVLMAQSNNGRGRADAAAIRTDEHERRLAGEAHILARIEAMGPQTKRTKFQGGMISDMSRFPSWSDERKALSALRAMIPRELSTELCIAAERDSLDGDRLFVPQGTGGTA